VLVVDDDRDTVESVVVLLGVLGHETRVAYDGAAALAAARAFEPDVVLLDIAMPNSMNGYEVASRLREQGGACRVLLVAMTGYGQERDVRRSQEAGFDCHLLKPFALEELLELLSPRPATPVTARSA
jgi:CheY-like chemotaxis protein